MRNHLNPFSRLYLMADGLLSAPTAFLPQATYLHMVSSLVCLKYSLHSQPHPRLWWTFLRIHMTVPRKESHACSEGRALVFFPLFQAVLYCQLGYRLYFAFCVIEVLFPKTKHTKHTAHSPTRFSISPWKQFPLWPFLYHCPELFWYHYGFSKALSPCRSPHFL